MIKQYLDIEAAVRIEVVTMLADTIARARHTCDIRARYRERSRSVTCSNVTSFLGVVKAAIDDNVKE